MILFVFAFMCDRWALAYTLLFIKRQFYNCIYYGIFVVHFRINTSIDSAELFGRSSSFALACDSVTASQISSKLDHPRPGTALQGWVHRSGSIHRQLGLQVYVG